MALTISIEATRIHILERLLNMIQEDIMRPELVTKTELRDVVEECEQPIIDIKVDLQDLEQRVRNLQRAVQIRDN